MPGPDVEITADMQTPRWSKARESAFANHPHTSVTRWEPEKSFGMNVALVTPVSVRHDDLVIYPMSHDYRIDRLVLRRLEVLSSVSGARVAAVETPAITMNFEDPRNTPPTRLPISSVVPLLWGHFEQLAAIQWTALRDVAGIGEENHRLIGESMGAQMAASIASISSPRSLDLVEPVNCQPMSLAELRQVGNRLATGEADLKRLYVENNRQRGWGSILPFELESQEFAQIDASLKTFFVQGRWALVSAIGLRRGIGNALQSSSLDRVTVWRGRESTVCSASSVGFLSRKLRRRGPRVCARTIAVEGRSAGHHVLTDLDAMVGFAIALNDQWNVNSADDRADNQHGGN